MSKRTLIGQGLAVLLALNAVILVGASRHDDSRVASPENVRSADLEKNRAAETQEYIAMFKLASNYRQKYGHTRIGDLVKGFWIGELPLDDEQAEAIVNLDDVVSGARAHSFRADVEYLEGTPADYRDYVARSKARRGETIDHAQLMVTLGLLTEPQAAFVTQRTLSGQSNEIVSLRDMDVQVMLGVTEDQKVALEQVGDKARSRKARLPLMSPDSDVRKRGGAEMVAIMEEADADAMEILTPEQREKWDQLTTRRTLPAEPPDMPVLSEAETARIKIEELSPVFRILAEKADTLELADEQKQLLMDLKQVTRLGLFWISQRKPADANAAVRDEFLKQAEQVALVGILTLRQAEEIEQAVQEN